jgi:hypothetical protein
MMVNDKEHMMIFLIIRRWHLRVTGFKEEINILILLILNRNLRHSYISLQIA